KYRKIGFTTIAEQLPIWIEEALS
ncbi:RNA-binding protein, partial [Enterococcus faecium]